MLNENITLGGIDLTYLSAVSGGDKAFEAEMIQSLRVEIDQRMQAVQAAVSEGNRDGVRLQAHSLKNLFAMLGLQALQASFQSIEANCSLMNETQIREQVKTGEQEWAEKTTALDKIRTHYQALIA